MPAHKGTQLPGGSRRGKPNKTTKAIKEMVEGALSAVGGQKYLEECARDPKLAPAFLGLVAKILPHQITGEGGGPVQVSSIQWTIVKSK